MEMALTVLVYGYFVLGLLLAALFFVTNPGYIIPVVAVGVVISSLVSQRPSCN